MRCPCGRVRPINPTIVGIQYDDDDVRNALILWNCPCRSTRAVKWTEAREPWKAIARQVELRKVAVCR